MTRQVLDTILRKCFSYGDLLESNRDHIGAYTRVHSFREPIAPSRAVAFPWMSSLCVSSVSTGTMHHLATDRSCASCARRSCLLQTQAAGLESLTATV
jgi:hypothetical protein